MMFPSHLLGTVLLGLLLSRIVPFQARDWVIALTFGVLIDLDHLLQIPAYIQANGLAALKPGEMAQWGGAWQGIMHKPVALALVGFASLALWSWLPLTFWGLHMFQDFVIARHFVTFGGPLEWAIIVALAGIVGLILVLDHRFTAPAGLSLRDHAAARFGIAALLIPAAAAAPDAAAPLSAEA